MSPIKYICVAGKNQIAVNAIKYLKVFYSDDYELFGVVNRNDTGINSWQPSFKKALIDNEVKIVKLEDIYLLDNLLFLSTEFDRIIKPHRFKSKLLFNLHFSYLPAYKGMNTSVMPILNNDQWSGVTLHFMDSGIDTGRIVDQNKFYIGDVNDSLDLYHLFNKKAFQLLKNNMEKLLANTFHSYEQSASGSTYHSNKSIDYSSLSLDIHQTADHIRNQIRAFSFRPFQLLKFRNVHVRFAEITDERSTLVPGEILEQNEFFFKISTIDYNLKIYIDRLKEALKATEEGSNAYVHSYINAGYPINDKNENGWDLLIVATYNGNKEAFDMLLKLGADIFTTNFKGTTLLMYALTPYESKNDDYFFKKLLKLGVSPTARDENGLSTIDWLDRRKINLTLK